MANSDIVNRLATIIHYLNRGYTVNVKELAKEFDISQRQVQKYIGEMKDLYDIESLGKQNYRMKHGHKIIGTESEDIEIAMALMKALQYNAIPQMSDIIDSAVPDSKKYKDIFLFDTKYEKINAMKEFYKLLDSIHTQRSCSFSYTKKDGTQKEVHLHPYRIANFSNCWYLLGYDLEYEKLKSYYINHISKVLLAAENYISNVKVEKEIEETFCKFDSPWFDGEPKKITLKATGDAKYYLDRNTPSHIDVLSQSENETLLLFHYYKDIEVITFVKKWLPDILIKDNPQIQKKIEKILQKYLNKN